VFSSSPKQHRSVGISHILYAYHYGRNQSKDVSSRICSLSFLSLNRLGILSND
jgi:hypothetical protein